MHCDACVSKIEKALNAVDGVTTATAKLNENQAIVEGDVPSENLINAINKTGYEAFLIDQDSGIGYDEKDSKEHSTKLYPLYLIFFYITVSTLLINRVDLSLNDIMLDFMGLFYIVFSFFKFLDYKNFPDTFKMYDPIAKTIPFYGWAYPFLETFLGLAFLLRVELYIALVTTLAILGSTTIGVIRSLMNKETIQCGCLGTALNLPMTTVTLVENSIMLFMALWMLFLL